MSATQTKHQFLDLFTYEKTLPPQKSGENTVFENCTFLKPFYTFAVDENVQAIEMSINLFIWNNDECIADEVYIP